ncbi:MAG: mechanosensitive ion channel [Salinivirgaceae bacterium]|nr:mechanosensitive ion channel [Salinivirgaceae bacterium]
MQKYILYFGLFLLLLVSNFSLSAIPTDSIPTDTIQKKEIVSNIDSVNVSSKIVNKVEKETQSLKAYFSATKIIISLIIILLTFSFLKLTSALLSVWAERNTKYRVTLKGFIPIIRIVVWVGAFSFIIVAVFRPPMASIFAVSASIGVAVGFAAQDLLKNIFGGIIIVIDKPFQIGDKVQLGNYYGEVVGIGLRSTRIVTPDDSLVTVPNSDVMSQSVSNANAGEENCQVVTVLYLPLSADLQKVKQSALEAAQVSKYIYLNKPIAVLFFQEQIGHKIMLKVKVKAYVNDIRNEFAFMSDVTQTLTNEFIEYYNKEELKGLY